MKTNHTSAKTLFFVLMSVAFFICIISVQGQVPSVVSYQGRLQANGTNFSGVGQFKLALVSPGTNTSRQATAVSTVNNGFITAIAVTDGGAGYVSVPAVSITDSTGNGASATANVSGGRVTSITMNNAGSGYSASPVVTIAPPPASFVYGSYWSNDGTSSAGSEPTSGVSVPVQQGLFTVFLGDTNRANMQSLPASVFLQPDARLRIWFSDGVSGFVQLTPDQRLGSVGYAMTAEQLSGPLGTDGNPILFNASGTEAMRIDPAGNVGIGTSNPSNRFTVANGDIGIIRTKLLSEGFEGAAFPPVGWTTGGNASWVRSTTVFNEGTAAAASGTIANGQFSYLQLNFTFPKAGLVKFRWKVSSVLTWDQLVFCLDNACTDNSGATQAISGEQDWNDVIVPITAGPHTFRWTYFKGTTGAGTDKGWIDNVRFESGDGNLNVGGDAYFEGNVGIGVNTPQQLLHLNVGPGHGEGMQIDSPIGGHSPAIYLNHNSTNGHKFRIASFGDNVDPGSFRIRDDTLGKDPLIIDASGNVGINGVLGVFGFGRSFYGGVATEVGAELINFGMNDGSLNRFGGTNNLARQGGLFRVDTRPGSVLFSFLGRQAGTNGDAATLGYIGSGGTVRFEVGTGQRFSLGNNGTFEIDASGTTAGRFLVRQDGNVGIGQTNPGARLQVVNATCDGTTWANSSDRALKEKFQPVDPLDVLARVTQLPVSRWNYKSAPSESHIGPIAQDFYSSFGLGSDDKHITTVDADGVALAAIQGLNQKLEQQLKERDDEIARLKSLTSELKAAVVELREHFAHELALRK